MNALRRLVRSLREAERDTEGALGVTGAQLFVLREIHKARTLTMGELARRTATAQSSISEVAARLDRKGLIARRRSTADHRRVEITLSDAGRELLAGTPDTVQERLLAAFGRLSADRRRQTADGLHAWITEAGLGTVAATMFFEPLRDSDQKVSAPDHESERR